MNVFSCLHLRPARFVFCLLSLLCLLAPASAPGEQKVAGERAKALICGKGTNVLVLQQHGFKNLNANRLAVPYNPMIYDVDGSALTLQDLKLPCEAYVEYKWSEGKEPQLFRLEVLDYGDDAKSFFTEKKKPKKLPE